MKWGAALLVAWLINYAAFKYTGYAPMVCVLGPFASFLYATAGQLLFVLCIVCLFWSLFLGPLSFLTVAGVMMLVAGAGEFATILFGRCG